MNDVTRNLMEGILQTAFNDLKFKMSGCVASYGVDQVNQDVVDEVDDILNRIGVLHAKLMRGTNFQGSYRATPGETIEKVKGVNQSCLKVNG